MAKQTPGFSIITDFGCKRNCPYCIWKTVGKNSQNIDIKEFCDKIENKISSLKKKKFSISGGGDPLNRTSQNFEIYSYFWMNIVSLCKKYKKKIDIHTSYIEDSDSRWIDGYNMPSRQETHYFDSIFYEIAPYLNRMVFHCSPSRFTLKEKETLKKYSELNKFKIRINFVISNEMSHWSEQQYLDFYKSVEDFCKQTGIQLAYRELITDSNELKPFKSLLDFCKGLDKRYENGRFVKQNDYNQYLFPNGVKKTKFLI